MVRDKSGAPNSSLLLRLLAVRFIVEDSTDVDLSTLR